MIEKKELHNSFLDRKSGIPLYCQIQERLLAQIQSGEFKLGKPLPSIQQIATSMGVSYMTVRQAVRALNDSGVLDSRQGIGTFVSGIKMERNFRQVLSFTEETSARGSKPSSKVLSFDIQSPTPKVQEALRLKEKDLVYSLRRVRYGDKVPMGIEYSSLPVQLFPGLIDNFNPEGSLYIELASKYGVQPMITDEVIEVDIATAEEARLLEMAPQSPVFLFTRISYIESGIPIEHAKSVYSGERYKISNRLMRTKQGSIMKS